jgi:hypothetical protein
MKVGVYLPYAYLQCCEAGQFNAAPALDKKNDVSRALALGNEKYCGSGLDSYLCNSAFF